MRNTATTLLEAPTERAESGASGGAYRVKFGRGGATTQVELAGEPAPASLTLQSAQTLAIRAGEHVRASGEGLAVHARTGNDAHDASIDLDARSMRVQAPTVALQCEHSASAVGVAHIAAQAVMVEANVLVTRVESLHSTAVRVVERARRVFREVEESLQIRAGTVEGYGAERITLRGLTATLFGRRATKIKAPRVDLG